MISNRRFQGKCEELWLALRAGCWHGLASLGTRLVSLSQKLLKYYHQTLIYRHSLGTRSCAQSFMCHLIFTTTLWDPHCCCYSFTNEKLRFLRDWTLAQSYIAKDLKPGPLPYKVHVLTSCSPLNSCIYYHAYQQHVAGPDRTSQFDPVWTDFKMRNSFQPKHLDLC